MNTCTVRLCADVDTLTSARVGFHLRDREKCAAGYIARVEIGDITIQTHGDAGVGVLALTFERLAKELRAEARRVTTAAMQSYVRNEWASAHPEEAVPLDRSGVCQACEKSVDQLYMVPSDSRGDIDAECCASCAGVPVELAEALSNAVRVAKPPTVFEPDGKGAHTGPPCPGCGGTRYAIDPTADNATVDCIGCAERDEQLTAGRDAEHDEVAA